MALWNRNNKPQNDRTKPQASIIGVDHTSVSSEPGVQSTGWVYKRLIGQNRVTYETLVAMKVPPAGVTGSLTVTANLKEFANNDKWTGVTYTGSHTVTLT